MKKYKNFYGISSFFVSAIKIQYIKHKHVNKVNYFKFHTSCLRICQSHRRVFFFNTNYYLLGSKFLTIILETGNMIAAVMLILRQLLPFTVTCIWKGASCWKLKTLLNRTASQSFYSRRKGLLLPTGHVNVEHFLSDNPYYKSNKMHL